MKPPSPAIFPILSIIIIQLFVSCGQLNKKKPVSTTRIDTTGTKLTREEQERLEKRRQMEDEEKIDSIRLEKILNKAIKIADQLKNKDCFKKEYVETIPDSSYQVDVTISSDFYFTNKSPHVIIRRQLHGTVYIDIFSTTGKQLQKVVSHEQWGMEYTGDTIRDINGDGLKDFVVNWYGSTGCCLKAFSDIYLLRADKRTFSKSFEFINPTFSPREKMIRGVCYGHPGETEMYKYKWNAEAVDTIEYVYYERNEKGKTGKVIVSKNNDPYTDNYKVLRKLNAPPNEYKKIMGYDWFEGNKY